MKQVTIENVKERIAHLELQAQIGGRLPIRHEFEMACLRQLVATMNNEPVAVVNGAWTLVYYRPPKEMGLNIGDKLYAGPQPGVDDDVRSIIGLLENNEWAEHCTQTVLGSRLESEITRLIGSVQPVQLANDADPSFDAMMRALDAFYADDDVPERAMLAAFKILLSDMRHLVHEPTTDNAAQQYEALATSAVSGKR